MMEQNAPAAQQADSSGSSGERKRRGKTRDAFAFEKLSTALERTIGEFVIPHFDDYKDEDDEDDKDFAAFCAINNWLKVPAEKMPPYRGFERVKSIIAESTAELEKSQFILDRIDVHISRLRRYLLNVSKKITLTSNLVERDFWEVKRDRASFLLWRYEWFADVLTPYSTYIQNYIKSQEENLQQQYKAEFAERLRAARRKSARTQADVAAELKLTPAAYSNYERGVRDLPMFTIYQLTEILGVSADYLFGVKNL